MDEGTRRLELHRPLNNFVKALGLLEATCSAHMSALGRIWWVYLGRR